MENIKLKKEIERLKESNSLFLERINLDAQACGTCEFREAYEGIIKTCDSCKLDKETCPVYAPPPINELSPFSFKLSSCPDYVPNGKIQECKKHDWVTIEGVIKCFDCGIFASETE